jgi:hypothetical protein
VFEGDRTKVGFTKPMVDFPAAILCSLIKFKIEAKVTVAIEVPKKKNKSLSHKYSVFWPTAAKSGYLF